MKTAGQLSVVLILVLSLLLTACGKNNNQPADPGATVAPTAEATAAPEENKLPDIDLYKFETEIPVVFAKSVHDVKVYPEGEDPENNAVYKLMASTMNIKPTNKFAAPFDAYEQKLKLGIASNDIPDIFYASQAIVEELIKNDLAEDLTPYYEKYASENTKKIMGYNDGLLFKGAQRDGKNYGMPNVSDALNGAPALYIRKDWMTKLNLNAPTSLEELLEMAKQFTTGDPDGNGKPDTYGLSMNNELDLQYTGILNAYGAYPKVYQKDADGKYTYGSLNPNMKLGLAKMAELYQAGVFNKEFATQNMGKSVEGIGNVGIFVGQFFSPLWPLQDVPKNFPGADYHIMPFPGLGGNEYKPYVPVNASGYFVVRKGFEHPEALMIILNNMAETGYSNLENEWAKGWAALNKDPKYSNAGTNNWLPVFLDRPDANMNRYTIFKNAIDTKDESKLLPDQLGLFDQVKKGLAGDAVNWPWPRTFLEGVPAASSYKNVERNLWFGSATETAKLKGAALAKLEEEFVIGVIVGTKKVDEFDTFVTQWNDMGGKQILDEMNASGQ